MGAKYPRNLLKNIIGLKKNFMVPESQYPESLALQKTCARFILPAAFIMLPTIDLND